METKLIVSDITQMGGQRICIGAISEEWVCVRPVLPYPGIPKSFLHLADGQVIRPFSRITLDLLEPVGDRPHTEDWDFLPGILYYRGELGERQQRNFLKKILDLSVDSIFGAQIHETNNRFFVEHGTGLRSLGTIKVGSLEKVDITNYKENINYHITFRDGSGKAYHINTTDLTFRFYVRHLVAEENNDLDKISRTIQEKLARRELYFRIGLGRGWNRDETQPQNRCYLLITGVYSFPDYLEGKCYADFERRPSVSSDPTSFLDEEIPF